MAQQTLLWTVLPNGRLGNRWRVSVVVSPRLTPGSAAERKLGHTAWTEWADWPATLAKQRLALEIGAGSVALNPVNTPDTAPDGALWRHLFHPALAVAPFRFQDMSRVNLRSYPLREVMGFVRRHYQGLAVQAGDGEHPTLLPWRAANPALKGLLTELGTRVLKIDQSTGSLEALLPGFGRFHERSSKDDGTRPHDRAVDQRVFNAASCIKAPARGVGRLARQTVFPLRALPPVWEDPALIRNGSIAVAPADREPRAQLMAQFSGPAEYAMWQADRFYHRTVPRQAQLAMKRPPFVGGTAPLAPPEFDFHQRIASYGDHPQLLRRLGLVIDCVLERNDLLDALLAAGPLAQGFMRLKLTAAAPHQTPGDQFPSSAWQASARRFVMQARTPDHAAGLLKLQGADDRYGANADSPFDLYQVDPDGAALKTVNFLLSAQNLVGKSLERGADGAVTYTTGDRQPVATLRSGGIGVSRHGRAGQVAMVAATAALNNAAITDGGASAAQVTLYAEDVLRGYRVDVHDQASGRWRSLCARSGEYTALARPDGTPARRFTLPPDEGHVKGASTTRAETEPDNHYLHETLFRWSGWSLAAPRPGRTIRDATVPGTHRQTEEVVEPHDPAQAAPKGNGLGVRVAATPGSLPKLRFDHAYRLRARLVDLAGNSLTLDDPELAGFEQASDALRYGRFEPVDPPALVLSRRLSEGESLERLVLRSNHDRRAPEYAADIAGPLARFYDNPDFEYGPTAERHVVPPKSSQQQCEQHGLFDDAIASHDPARIKKAYEIAARESGSLMLPVPGAQIELVTPQKAALAATVQGPGALIQPPDLADDTRDRFAAGQYLVHREAIVPVPYLPDAACGGIALEGVPGLRRWTEGLPLVTLAPGLLGYVLGRGARAAFTPEHKDRLMLLLDFDRDPGDDPGAMLKNDWPHDVRSLRLVLAEQAGEVSKPPCGDEHTEANPPKWDFDAGVLAIFLPKGHVARLRYASFVHDRLVGHFGLPRWLPAALQQPLQAQALAGMNWMFTPWRALTLVHATQQPVCPPWLEGAWLQRAAGAMHADLLARQVHLHGPSSGHFEIVAEWDEWVDDPLTDRPAAPGPRRVHHEARLGEIRLPENSANHFDLLSAVNAQHQFDPVGGQVLPADLAGRPAVPANRHEFGDTRFRFVRYRLCATSRFREYLPPALFADPANISRDGPPLQTHQVVVQALDGLDADHDAGAPVRAVTSGGSAGTLVPASAPPQVPELVYVVPTFRWLRPAPAGATRQSTRLGNGLRVYLERPWFSSGDGELLGVVIAGNGTPLKNITPAQLPFVTQWGLDPLWLTAVPENIGLRVADFKAAVADERSALVEDPTVGVHVVGHRVHFSPERQLWYADIELDAGATYMPFVRLALVRYQPNALAGQRLSRVVIAEFAQVLPRRRAVLTRNGQTINLSVHGPMAMKGPMRRANSNGTAVESEYADISFELFGGETGRNRLELVLQAQQAGMDSDLAWDDLAVLADGPVGEAPPAAPALPGGVVLQRTADEAPPVRTRGGRTLRFDRMEARAGTTLGTATGTAPGTGVTLQPGTVTVAELADPAVWSHTATLPALPAGRPVRLLLREFERFYTDRTVPETRAGKVVRRVVVEERLVYAETFPLG